MSGEHFNFSYRPESLTRLDAPTVHILRALSSLEENENIS